MELDSVKLMRHQLEGVEYLLSRRSGILAFEQGLGKTLVAIEAFRRLRSAGTVERMTVLCPNSLKRTWEAEISKFAPDLTTYVVEGNKANRRRGLSSTNSLVVILNYEAARNDIIAVQALLNRVQSALVLDESHFVKNHRSLTTIAARHFAPLCAYRWLLTGTPVTNSPTDVYSQVCLVADDEPLGSYAAFEARFGDRNPSANARKALASKIAPYIIRRTKEDCLDLPSKSVIDVDVEMPAWQRKMYEATRDDLAHEVEGMSEREFRKFVPTALVRLLRLSQIASNPALVLPAERRTPGKFAALDQLLPELVEAGRQVIVWSYYTATIQQLARRYEKLGVATLHGPTPPEDRQAVASRFQSGTDLRVLIANPAAAGTGFTLTAASYAIYESLSWRYDHYAQSQDRNHRIGQTLPVTYFRLLGARTIERVIADALRRKSVLARDLVGDEASEPAVPRLDRETVLAMLNSDTGAKELSLTRAEV